MDRFARFCLYLVAALHLAVGFKLLPGSGADNAPIAMLLFGQAAILVGVARMRWRD